MSVDKTQLVSLIKDNDDQPLTLEKFSPDIQQKVKDYVTQLDTDKSTSILQFGVKMMDDISRHADRVYDHIRVKDTGEAGKILLDMLDVVNKVDVNKLITKEESGLANLPVIGKMFSKLNKFLQETKKSSDLIEELSHKLSVSSQSLLSDIQVLDELYVRNMTFMNNLELHYIAAKLKVQELQLTLTDLTKKAEETNDMADAQAVQNLQSIINRLENKAHDLLLTRQARIQQAPIIRTTQEGHQLTAEKINTVQYTTVPLWKDAVSLAITQERGKNALAMLDKANETTNRLMKHVSDQNKLNTIEIKRKVQSGVVDLETLKYLQRNTIETLQESIRIDKESAVNRTAAEKEIEVMNTELKTKLIEMAQQR